MNKFTAIINKNQVYKGNGFSLRPIEKKDIQIIRKWRNDQIEVLRQTEKIGYYQQIKYYNEIIQPSFSCKFPRMILFSLIKNDDEVLIAYGGFVHINWEYRIAEVSFLCDTNYFNHTTYKDIFLSFMDLISTIAKIDLDLKCLYSETFSFRNDHLTFLELCHYKQYGIKRKSKIVDGNQVHSLLHQNILI